MVIRHIVFFFVNPFDNIAMMFEKWYAHSNMILMFLYIAKFVIPFTIDLIFLVL